MTSAERSPGTRAARREPAEAGDRMWASVAHFGGAAILVAPMLGAFGVGGVVQAGVALLGVIPSLALRLTVGRRAPITRRESSSALNFMLTVLVVVLAWITVSTIIVYLTASALNAAYVAELGNALRPPVDPSPAIASLRMWMGVPTVVVTGLAALLCLVAGLFVRGGRTFHYPLALHLVR